MEARVRVAVVDDEESVRTALKRFLGGYGFDVVVFGSGEEFLGWLSSNRPTCAVLDVHMPGMTGLEIHERVKQMGVGVPCIVLTADGTMRDAALAGGAAGFVGKLADGRELLVAIRAATRGKGNEDNGD
jgi:FixJ family two-component response regulator